MPLQVVAGMFTATSSLKNTLPCTPMHSTRTVFLFSPPDVRVSDYMACLMEEPEADSGLFVDEGAPQAGSGWYCSGKPMMIGSGSTTRQFCDGQSLSSPRRWPPHSRKYPSSSSWLAMADCYQQVATRNGTPQLLMKLVLGKVESSTF